MYTWTSLHYSSRPATSTTVSTRSTLEGECPIQQCTTFDWERQQSFGLFVRRCQQQRILRFSVLLRARDTALYQQHATKRLTWREGARDLYRGLVSDSFACILGPAGFPQGWHSRNHSRGQREKHGIVYELAQIWQGKKMTYGSQANKIGSTLLWQLNSGGKTVTPLRWLALVTRACRWLNVCLQSQRRAGVFCQILRTGKRTVNNFGKLLYSFVVLVSLG